MGGSDIYIGIFQRKKQQHTKKFSQVQKNSTYNIGSIRHEETVLSFSSILVRSGSTAVA